MLVIKHKSLRKTFQKIYVYKSIKLDRLLMYPSIYIRGSFLLKVFEHK